MSASMLSSATQMIYDGNPSDNKNRTRQMIIIMVIFAASLISVIGIFLITLYVAFCTKRKHKRMFNDGTEWPPTATQLPRQPIRDNEALSPGQETLPMGISTNKNNACSMSEPHSYDTNIDHGSGFQTKDEERNSKHASNSDQHKRLITPAGSKNVKSDVRKESAFEGPYSIVPIFDSDSDSDTANSSYDILDGLGYKKEQRRHMLGHLDYEGINRNLDTDDNNYEVLRRSYKFDNRESI